MSETMSSDQDQCTSDAREQSQPEVPVSVIMAELSLETNSNTQDSKVFEAKDQPCQTFSRMHQLWEEQKLCDVLLDVGGKEIHAHRLVLAASSNYFYSMFVRDMMESRQDRIELKGVDPDAMTKLVDFAYSTKLEITTANVQSLMTAASLFDFPAVFHATATFLAGQLHPTNCIGIRMFAKSHGSEALIKASSVYFREHFQDAITSEEFVNVAAEDLADLLDSPLVNVRSEEDVYHAVELWLAHNPEERKDTLSLILSKIRLPLLSPTFLTQVVEANSFIKKSLDCRDLIDEAKNYHLMPDSFRHSTEEKYQPRKSTVGLLFAIGGRGSVGEPFCSVEYYDFRTNTWHVGPDLKARRRHVGVACLDGVLYAVGGHDGDQHLNTVERFDLKLGHWEFVQPMKKLRRGIAVGVVGEPMYAVGGLDDVSCYKAVERYDPQSNEWKEVACLHTPRGGVGVATLGKYLYAAGGNDGGASLDTVERYNPHIDKWTEVGPMAKRRAGVGLAALNGYLYAVGGFDDASPLNTVERYDPDCNQWEFVQPMHVCRGGVGVASLGGYLFAIGGHDGRTYLNTAEMYCPKFNTWTMVASMNTSRAGAGVVSCPPTSVGLKFMNSAPSRPESFGSL